MLQVIERVEGSHAMSVGGGKGFDKGPFVREARGMNARTRVARRTVGGAIDGRTSRHRSHQIGRRKRRRKRIEGVFGWIKTAALLRKTRRRGRERAGWVFVFAAAAYNLMRMRNLKAA